jgi:iron uptake system component EfeO
MLTLPLLLGSAALILGAAACKSDSDSDSGSTAQIKVSLTNDGCSPSTIDAKTGPTTFIVTNSGAAAVTELEVMSGDRILGEVENIVPGLSGKFTLNLRSGSYVLYCPGGKTAEKGTLTVKGDDTTGSGTEDPDLAAANTTYKDYVESQVGQLVTAVGALRDAIASNNLQAAKDRYADARPYYERIEPIAESFGDLDPAIDERADDKEATELTGFHRIEYGLWVDGSTDGLKDLADQLVKDIQTLKDQVPGYEYDPLATANGAVDLLGEVTASKITGEEERYSHLDLVDFAANVDGAKEAFSAVRAALVRRDPDLATTLDARFKDVYDALANYKKGNSYVVYTDLTSSDTKLLGQKIDALGEPLSQLAESLNKAPKN